MILKTVESCRVDMLIEKANSASFEVVVFGLVILHHQLELLALLVIFELLFGIDILVFKSEVLILEIFKDLYTCLKIDWCLVIAIANNTFAGIFEPCVVARHPVILNEFTWSLVESILVVLGVVVVKRVDVVASATRHASHYR